MKSMLRLVRPPPRARIIDVGGTPYLWDLCEHDFHVTLVNLPGEAGSVRSNERFAVVEADGCDLRGRFDDNSFDVAFSNSVIEHVGDESRQAAFAAEIRRLAPAYWVQTPSAAFPIEAHTGVPFYWHLPSAVRERLHRRWHRTLPAWTESVVSTRVLSRKRLEVLFPNGKIYSERVLGLLKSHAAYKASALSRDGVAEGVRASV